jgi:hypothetical protein
MTPQPMSGRRHRHVARDLHQRMLVNQHLLGKRRQVQKLVDVPAVPAQALGRARGILTSGVWQIDMCPVRQYSQCPQNTDRQVITGSPGFT